MKWTRETLRVDLIRIFQEQTGSGVEITEPSELVADLHIDSLGVMELIASIEDAFTLKIPTDALREIETVGDVVKAIEARLRTDGRIAE